MYSSQWFWHIVNQWQSIKAIIIQIEEKIRNIYMNRNRRRHVPRRSNGLGLITLPLFLRGVDDGWLLKTIFFFRECALIVDCRV